MHRAACFLLIILPAFIAAAAGPNFDSNAPTAIPEDYCNRLSKTFQVPFMPNRGQVDGHIAFYAGTFGGTVFVTTGGDIRYMLPASGDPAKSLPALSEQIVGGTVGQVSGRKRWPARLNRFIGRDQSYWQTDITAYESVDFGQVYDGIGMTLTAYGNNVEKLFYLQPGAEPKQIRLRMVGATDLSIGATGELMVETSNGHISFTPPAAYQDIDGHRTYVSVDYVIDGLDYGFAVGPYDHSRPLVIDPLLAATFIGGGGLDGGWPRTDIVVDANGDVYITGTTPSVDFPTEPTGYDTSYSGGAYDIFISKFSCDLGTLLASTFFGGISLEDCANIALDGDGNVLLAGHTRSSDFPYVPGSYDTLYNGGQDVFVAKFSGDLDSLLAATFIGGTGIESTGDIAVGPAGDVFVVAKTRSTDFPITPGAFDSTWNGIHDIFVARLDAGLQNLLAATYVGLGCIDDYPAIAVGSDGAVYITGTTESAVFPIAPGAYDDQLSGGYDAFVAKLGPGLDTLLASTYLGGANYDFGYDVFLDGDARVIIAGHAGPGFPVSPDAADPSVQSFADGFVSVLDAGLSTLVASTCLGGANNDCAMNIGVDGNGMIYVSGYTDSPDFPTGPGDDSLNGEVDAFLVKLSANLSAICGGRVFGGAAIEEGNALAVDAEGIIFVAGATSSPDFPVTIGAYDEDFNGGIIPGYWGGDAYVARLVLPQLTRIDEGVQVSEAANSQGVSWPDYDDDGWPDLYVTNFDYPAGADNSLFHNDGNGSFEKITLGDIVSDGGQSRGSTWGDYDNDGDLDCYVANFPAQVNFLYANNGDGSFTRVTNSPIGTDVAGSSGPSWADADNDGDLDLYVTNSEGPVQGLHDPYPNYFYRNEGGAFVRDMSDVIATDSGTSYGVAWADYDNDGDIDLFVGNVQDQDNRLYTNNGDGTFSRMEGQDIVTDGGESFGGSWGDYDNDGDLDLFVANVCYYTDGNDFLYANNGDGTFTRITEGVVVNNGGYSFGSCWGDYDNDGDLDLFVANFTHPTPDGRDFLYRNNGDGTFALVENEEVSSDSGSSYGAAWGDYDRDGDLDLYVIKIEGVNAMFKNNGTGNNWLEITCRGTKSNRSAIGAKVRIKAVIDGVPVWQMREISGQTGFCGQNSLTAHFGLGDASVVDSVRVEWPSGVVDQLTDVAVNQFVTIAETVCGDANGDGGVNVGDAVFIVNFVFRNGPAPDPMRIGDANADGSVNVGDAVFLINFVFKNGPEPTC